MNVTFAERADQLSDALRELEHQAQDGDQLFYCAYLLGLLGLHSGVEGEGQEAFDGGFYEALQEALVAENVADQDQKNILALWEATRKATEQ
ncbi:YfcL family protein [Marinomonas epiphytica]